MQDRRDFSTLPLSLTLVKLKPHSEILFLFVRSHRSVEGVFTLRVYAFFDLSLAR